MRIKQTSKQDYAYFEKMTTRWRDNDVYGHMNNVVFYEYVDTVVNSWLIKTNSLVIPRGRIIGLVVETKCTYFSEIGFPGVITAGLKVNRIGKSSVQYEVGLFSNQEDKTAARVLFTHVCVDSNSRKPVKIPKELLKALKTINKD
ncbi:MAG: thioesterase family protein [Paracoccaceae bacterium]|nr:thioesterase family protein [Paracoccaceae bacterium]